MTTVTLAPVPPRSLNAALAHVRNGGELVIPTYTQTILITARTLARWEAAGQWLLREEGDGYRMRSGRRSVYLLPGQLKYR